MSFYNPFRELRHFRQRVLLTSFKEKMNDVFWIIAGRLTPDEKHTHSQAHLGLLDYGLFLIPFGIQKFAHIANKAHDHNRTFGTRLLRGFAHVIFAAFSILRLIITLPLMFLALPIVAITHGIAKITAEPFKSTIKNYPLSSNDIDSLKKTGLDTAHITTLGSLLENKSMRLRQVQSCVLTVKDDSNCGTLTLSTADKSASIELQKNKNGVAVLKSLKKLHLHHASMKPAAQVAPPEEKKDVASRVEI